VQKSFCSSAKCKL